METENIRVESSPADIPGLVAQARAAYQQNRIKECLALIKAALLVDPTNPAAVEMQSAVRFDMQRDLSDARALIEESRNKPEAAKYRKAAEIILLKALYLDPDSEGAKTLLSSIRIASEPRTAGAPALAADPAPATRAIVVTPPVPVAAPTVAPPPPPVVAAAPIVVEATVAHPAPPVPTAPAARVEAPPSAFVTQPELPPEAEPIPFTAATTFFETPDQKKGKRPNLTVPIVIVAIAVLGGGLLLARQRRGTASNVAAATEPVNSENVHSQGSAQSVSYPLSSAVAPPASSMAEAAQTKLALTALDAPPLPGTAPGNTASASNSPAVPANAAAPGSLAVSSAIAAEIYMGDKYLGSTPTTLQLPAGNQTIEYRHGDLRTVITHVIKANETTSALISFVVAVQLNANPWANVFVEGSPRLPLGQTPLSGVQLPIGSVLVFENPNFPSKSHKIAVNDKTIQMVFP